MLPLLGIAKTGCQNPRSMKKRKQLLLAAGAMRLLSHQIFQEAQYLLLMGFRTMMLIGLLHLVVHVRQRCHRCQSQLEI
jgi:hypothetical protein